MKKASTVKEYIENTPAKHRRKLIRLRELIKTAVPQAEEKISYSMPYYGYKGRLAYFALAKNHIGLYIPPPVIKEHSEELKEYKTSVSAVQFPLDKPLPEDLIIKLVRARKAINER